MDPLWSETCWSTFKYFIILIVSTYYILCISWIIKCLIIIEARCKHENNSRCLASRNFHRLSETSAGNVSHSYSWYDLCILENSRLWLAAVGSAGPPRKQELFHSWLIWRWDELRSGMRFLFWGFWSFTMEIMCSSAYDGALSCRGKRTPKTFCKTSDSYSCLDKRSRLLRR